MADDSNKANFQCSRRLLEAITETQDTMMAIEGHVIALRELSRGLNFDKNPEYAKHKKYLELTDKQVEKIHDLGLIALFANFEAFMYEILKELYRKYPDPYLSEKQVKYADVRRFETIDEWKEYIIDETAIEKSRDIDAWADHLKRNFGIGIFRDDDQKERINILNLLRNALLHADGKTNSKFSTRKSQYLRIKVPLGDSLPRQRQKHVSWLHGALKDIAERISLL